MLQRYLYSSLLTKFKLVVAYNGNNFCGFQIQDNQPTVEGSLVYAVQAVCGDVNKVYASGRTDAGVHADGQVVHFETAKIFDTNRLLTALNHYLPEAIVVKSCEEVSQDFDARYSAKKREYRYLFTADDVPLYLRDRVVKVAFQPDDSQLEAVASTFCGTHDFECFRSTGSTVTGTVRTVYECSISKQRYSGLYKELKDIHMYELKICANGFLYRMVRHIVGAVFEVLRGRVTSDAIKEALLHNKTDFNYTVAPAKGLSLVKVTYK